MRWVRILAISLTAGLLLAGCEFWVEPAGEKYALVYGISIYEESKTEGVDNNLSYTDNDARDFAILLAEKGYSVYLRLTGDSDSDPGNMTDFSINTDPTQFETDIASFQALLKEEDTFLFYFSGHGSFSSSDITGSRAEASPSDSNEEYLVFNSTGNTIEESDYYSDDQFYQQFRTLPSIRNIVIVDACFSGGLIGQVYDVDTTAPQYYDGNETRDGSLGLILNAFFSPDSADIPPEEAIVITAAGEREVSLEELNVYKHGIFTYYLLQTAYQDRNGDGLITTSEAYSYTRYMLMNDWNAYVAQNYSSAQYPDLQYYPRISGGPVDYVLFEAD